MSAHIVSISGTVCVDQPSIKFKHVCERFFRNTLTHSALIIWDRSLKSHAWSKTSVTTKRVYVYIPWDEIFPFTWLTASKSRFLFDLTLKRGRITTKIPLVTQNNAIFFTCNSYGNDSEFIRIAHQFEPVESNTRWSTGLHTDECMYKFCVEK